MSLDIAEIWPLIAEWDHERPRLLSLEQCRLQLYMGAMEIPMVAFRPPGPVVPSPERLAALVPTLVRAGLVLDLVEAGRNYKINRHGSGEYIGRILPDALKFHAERVLEVGPAAVGAIVSFYLGLPRA